MSLKDGYLFLILTLLPRGVGLYAAHVEVYSHMASTCSDAFSFGIQFSDLTKPRSGVVLDPLVYQRVRSAFHFAYGIYEKEVDRATSRRYLSKSHLFAQPGFMEHIRETDDAFPEENQLIFCEF